MTSAEKALDAPPAASMSRINVVGTTGSGKTTLARHLASCLDRPHIEMDALHWLPNWTSRPDAALRPLVADAVSAETWVLDGNYSRVRDIVWARATTIVWLNYTLQVMMWRLVRRTFKRWWSREPLWGTNHESLRTHLLTRDSLFLWQLQTYKRRRAEYPRLFAQPQHAHLRIVEHRSPRATARWVAHLGCTGQPHKELHR